MLRNVILVLALQFPLILFSQTNYRAIEQPERLAGGDGNYFMQPIWSPDGSKIAFTESNYKGVWLMNSNGSELIQVSDETGAGFDFIWSPDSREILSRVYKYEGAIRINAIKSFNVYDNSVKNLTGYVDNKLGLPNWTADNSQIYYLKDGNLETIGTGRKFKTENQTRILYQNKSKLYTGSNITDMKALSAGGDEINLNVRLSPDGQKIAYEVMGGDLYTMNVDGTGITDLGVGYNARWSPDSRYLVYMINADDGHRFLSSDLYISSTDGDENFRLTFTDDQLEMNPAWSGDGKSIVFDTYDNGTIYKMRVSDQ